MTLRSLIVGLPVESRLSSAISGEQQWPLADHLLAVTVDMLNIANWQRSAKKGDPPPKLMPRPGVDDGRKRYGRGTDMTNDEMRDWLNQWAPEAVNDD